MVPVGIFFGVKKKNIEITNKRGKDKGFNGPLGPRKEKAKKRKEKTELESLHPIDESTNIQISGKLLQK